MIFNSLLESETYYNYSPPTPPNKDFEYNLYHLTIDLRLYANDYKDGSIAVFEGSTLCGTKILTGDTETFTMTNNPACGDFTLNL